MAKYKSFKTRSHATNPAISMQWWREDAERAYWQMGGEPGFLANIPPDIIRTYQPGTGMACPQVPELSQTDVEDAFDTSSEDLASELQSLKRKGSLSVHGTPDPRGKVSITRPENIIEHALRTDGTVIKMISRPFLEWCIQAVRQTPLAIPFIPARGRGKTKDGGDQKETDAMHVTVQREAFEAHPMALMLYPERFDERISKTDGEALMAHVRELIELYDGWVNKGRSFDLAHHAKIERHLRDFVRNPVKDYMPPLVQLFASDPIAKMHYEDAQKTYSAAPMMQCRMVIARL